MKNLKPFSIQRIVFALVITAISFSCSDDGDENQNNEVDLTVISGEYVGVWSWEPGTGAISLLITPENGDGKFNVEYFESGNFLPKNNSDGVTPDARGTLQIDGTSASIALKYNTDAPECFGDFTGTGTRTEDGVLSLIMNIDDCNVEDEPATWKATKRKDI